MANIKSEGENNYGEENCAQDGTHCPQGGTEGGTRYSQDSPQDGTCYSQDCPQDGTRYSKDGPEGGTRRPQDGAKAYIANCVADSTAGSPPPRYLSNRY